MVGQFRNFCVHQFELNAVQDGQTVREHLLAAVAATTFDAATNAKARAHLRGPDLPQDARHAWSVFAALSRTRTMSSAGPNPINYLEIDAYCRVTHDQLTPLDVALIREADDAMAATLYARREP